MIDAHTPAPERNAPSRRQEASPRCYAIVAGAVDDLGSLAGGVHRNAHATLEQVGGDGRGRWWSVVRVESGEPVADTIAALTAMCAVVAVTRRRIHALAELDHLCGP
jgi:hypothetical protein